MSSNTQQYKLVNLPDDLVIFRSVKSGTPFYMLRQYLSAEVGTALTMADVAICAADYAYLKTQTHGWMDDRQRLGMEVVDADDLCIEGLTAPFVNRKLRRSLALVAVGGAR